MNIFKKFLDERKRKLFIRDWKYKADKQSGAIILEKAFSGHPLKVERDDGVVLTRGDIVVFNGHDGSKIGPLVIDKFVPWDPVRSYVDHCSAHFKDSSTMVFSIGLLDKINTNI